MICGVNVGIPNLNMKIVEAQDETEPPDKVAQCCQMEQPPPYLTYITLFTSALPVGLLTNRVYFQNKIR